MAPKSFSTLLVLDCCLPWTQSGTWIVGAGTRVHYHSDRVVRTASYTMPSNVLNSTVKPLVTPPPLEAAARALKMEGLLLQPTLRSKGPRVLSRRRHRRHRHSSRVKPSSEPCDAPEGGADEQADVLAELEEGALEPELVRDRCEDEAGHNLHCVGVCGDDVRVSGAPAIGYLWRRVKQILRTIPSRY